MEKAGFHVIAAVDNDPHAIKTYRENFRSSPHVLKWDIRTVKPEKLAEFISAQTVDVIIGGPPCQGFSVARRVDGSNHGTRTIEDERRTLFRCFLRNVKYFHPKIFIMENVRGIRTVEGSRIFKEIFWRGKGIGYRVHEALLRAWQYGVPQKRIRQLFFGVRNDMPAFSIDDWLSPTHADPLPADQGSLEAPVTLWEAIGDLPCLKAGEKNNQYDRKKISAQLCRYGARYIRDVLEIEKTKELTSHIARSHSMRDLRDFERLKEGETSAQALRRGVKMEFPYNRQVFNDRYTRQHRNRLSSTIVAHLSKDGLMFIHPTQNRSLTPREAARIQSFPDGFTFPVPLTHQYRLIGNAVPPLLGQAIGRAVKGYLQQISRVSLPCAAGE